LQETQMSGCIVQVQTGSAERLSEGLELYRCDCRENLDDADARQCTAHRPHLHAAAIQQVRLSVTRYSIQCLQ